MGKVQKIREEVVRMHNLLPVMDSDNISVNYADRICTTLEMYIDSLQKEPVSGLDNGNMPIERWEKAVEAASNQRNYRCSKGLTETKDDYFVDGVQWADEHPKEEPVSEDLEEAAKSYSNNLDNICGSIGKQTRNAFKAGAKWKEQQFEKNRLAACDKQTEEEAEIEQSFVMGIIECEHRQPTFDDAIKYGMRLQKEQMMTKAIDGVITFDYYGNDNNIYGCIAHNSFCLEDIGLKDRDKVKMIIVKDEMS